MEENKVQDIISSQVSHPVSVQHERERGYIDWKNLGDLYDEGLISNMYGFRNNLVAYIDKKEIFRMEWAVVKNSGVGYINWIRVHEDYQRKGIAGKVRRYIVKCLTEDPNTNIIYTKPLSKPGKGLVKSQDFERIEDDNLDGWFYSYC